MQNKPDCSIFYSLACLNNQRESAVKEKDWGMFFTDDTNTSPMPGHEKKIDLSPQINKNPLFDTMLAKVSAGTNQLNGYYSAKYYADCFDLISQHLGSITKIVEFNPKFGDLSCLLAGLAGNMNITYDLVDTDKQNLLSVYHKIKQTFPEVLSKIRLFFGDLPIYIKNIVANSTDMHLIHYQGHNFNDAVRDLGATFFVRKNIFATIVHDTHLRTTDMNYYTFTDAALYAIFGINVKYLKLGEEASEETALDVSHNPPRYHAAHRVDGLYIPYSQNHFRYPHPNTALENFIYASE